MALLPPPSNPTVAAIYAAYELSASQSPSARIGASLIGYECERHIWYSYRWVRQAQFAGRILRLFETGNIEEARMVKNLRAAGITVMDLDPDTGEQWTYTACNGHFVDKGDGIAIGILEAPKTPHALELKTSNVKNFNALQKHGLEKAQPKHLAQLLMFMHLAGLERGFYLALCKNTDQLYSERVYPNPELATRLLDKAQRIIDAAAPPARISDNPDFYVCKLCDFAGVCHEGQAAERNCRTCLNSTPIPGGQWHCAVFDMSLKYAAQREGCITSHRYIPSLVQGEQVDAAEDGSWIEYKMADGTTWIDRGIQ